MAAVKISRKNTSDDDDDDLLVPAWGRFCVKAPHQPTTFTHSLIASRPAAAPDNER